MAAVLDLRPTWKGAITQVELLQDKDMVWTIVLRYDLSKPISDRASFSHPSTYPSWSHPQWYVIRRLVDCHRSTYVLTPLKSRWEKAYNNNKNNTWINALNMPPKKSWSNEKSGWTWWRNWCWLANQSWIQSAAGLYWQHKRSTPDACCVTNQWSSHHCVLVSGFLEETCPCLGRDISRHFHRGIIG